MTATLFLAGRRHARSRRESGIHVHLSFAGVTGPEESPASHDQDLRGQGVKEMNPTFKVMYSTTGRPSIPPERLLKVQLLIALYTVRSDRMLCEQLDYDILLRWFLDMNLEESSFDATSFTKNRERLLAHEVSLKFFDAVVGKPAIRTCCRTNILRWMAR